VITVAVQPNLNSTKAIPSKQENSQSKKENVTNPIESKETAVELPIIPMQYVDNTITSEPLRVTPTSPPLLSQANSTSPLPLSQLVVTPSKSSLQTLHKHIKAKSSLGGFSPQQYRNISSHSQHNWLKTPRSAAGQEEGSPRLSITVSRLADSDNEEQPSTPYTPNKLSSLGANTPASNAPVINPAPDHRSPSNEPARLIPSVPLHRASITRLSTRPFTRPAVNPATHRSKLTARSAIQRPQRESARKLAKSHQRAVQSMELSAEEMSAVNSNPALWTKPSFSALHEQQMFDFYSGSSEILQQPAIIKLATDSLRQFRSDFCASLALQHPQLQGAALEARCSEELAFILPSLEESECVAAVVKLFNSIMDPAQSGAISRSMFYEHWEASHQQLFPSLC
jgi:hypothetical protein